MSFGKMVMKTTIFMHFYPFCYASAQQIPAQMTSFAVEINFLQNVSAVCLLVDQRLFVSFFSP